jgi:hypothetical protein
MRLQNEVEPGLDTPALMARFSTSLCLKRKSALIIANVHTMSIPCVTIFRAERTPGMAAVSGINGRSRWGCDKFSPAGIP